jgi:hypothetical protein
VVAEVRGSLEDKSLGDGSLGEAMLYIVSDGRLQGRVIQTTYFRSVALGCGCGACFALAELADVGVGVGTG